LETLAKSLEQPGGDAELLLMLAHLNGDKAVVTAVQKLATRTDLPAAVTGRALLVLRAKSGAVSKEVIAAAGKRFLEAVEKGAVKIGGVSDQLLLLELLEAEGPSPFALKQVAGLLNGQTQVRAAAHDVARKFGTKAAPLAETLWPRALDAKARVEDRIDVMATLVRIEAKPALEKWEKLLADASPAIRTEAVRDWRAFKDQPEM